MPYGHHAHATNLQIRIGCSGLDGCAWLYAVLLWGRTITGVQTQYISSQVSWMSFYDDGSKRGDGMLHIELNFWGRVERWEWRLFEDRADVIT